MHATTSAFKILSHKGGDIRSIVVKNRNGSHRKDWTCPEVLPGGDLARGSLRICSRDLNSFLIRELSQVELVTLVGSFNGSGV